ncbi:MAG: hypothetical protein HFI08_02175 [Bacilli bacterium]|jgi:hypothetical protein|nr:hypothetical protein [Bacilli bacterium]
MSLVNIKDYFKEAFLWNESISIGKIDNNQEKAICFYPSKREISKINRVGGKQNAKYNLIPITILLRYTKNQSLAEAKAKEIYDFFDERSFLMNEKRIFVITHFNGPIWLGTDEKGVYEYSFEFDLYEER